MILSPDVRPVARSNEEFDYWYARLTAMPGAQLFKVVERYSPLAVRGWSPSLFDRPSYGRQAVIDLLIETCTDRRLKALIEAEDVN